MTADNEIPGFRVPFHRSLMQVVLMAGLPRSVALMLWTTAGALGLGMRQLWVVPFALVLHFGIALLTRNDPYFFEIFTRALKAPGTLQP
jgi:type IV secretion system protein VirB3